VTATKYHRESASAQDSGHHLAQARLRCFQVTIDAHVPGIEEMQAGQIRIRNDVVRRQPIEVLANGIWSAGCPFSPLVSTNAFVAGKTDQYGLIRTESRFARLPPLSHVA
jgi:hypothetical protein